MTDQEFADLRERILESMSGSAVYDYVVADRELGKLLEAYAEKKAAQA